MNSGEAIRKDSTGASQQHNSTICIYEVLGVLQVLQLDKSRAADVQANQGGNNNEPILETLDIHIMFPDLRALSIRPELYASLSDILAYTPKFRYAKVVMVHFFRPPLASRADDLRTEGCFLGQAKAEAMRSRLEAVFPAVIQGNTIYCTYSSNLFGKTKYRHRYTMLYMDLANRSSRTARGRERAGDVWESSPEVVKIVRRKHKKAKKKKN
ncbi:hypothetical protein CPC08DRAFT_144915 [Agrocybe pediades]|nr:hypothetical protein CPC08DRAFT_144915 [Agrocybe pediades]